MQTNTTKLELDIQSLPEGKFEATCSSMEGFVTQGVSILETIEQAIDAASQEIQK